MSDPYRVIVAGTRTFADWPLLRDTLDCLLMRRLPAVEIVSGLAKGADTLGVRYALEKRLPVKRFPAEWATHGKAAGPRRNKLMAEYAQALVLFWDGESRGSADMLRQANERGLAVRIVRIPKEPAE